MSKPLWKKFKIYKSSLIIVIAIVFIPLILWLYSYGTTELYYWRLSNAPVPTDWKRYTNQEEGFSFSYPLDYTLAAYKEHTCGYNGCTEYQVVKLDKADATQKKGITYNIVMYAKALDNSASRSSNRNDVSDHRGSNSQLIDFEGVEIRSVFAAKMKKAEKSNT